MSRLGLKGLVPISNMLSPPTIFSFVFPYHQIKVDESLLHAAINYWVPTRHVFCFNGVELYPTIEEFHAIMGELEINNLFFPTMCGDLPSLLQVVLGIPPAMANRWCILASSTLSWFLHTFPGRPFSWVRGHIHTFFVPFAYVLLHGTSWSKGDIVWKTRCA